MTRACIVKDLPPEDWLEAARTAVRENPENAPFGVELDAIPNERLTLLLAKFWGATVRLTVGFLDAPPPELRRIILGHLNTWGETAEVSFSETADQSGALVRISRGGGGYWSYLGTDILLVKRDQPTMNLEGLTIETPEREVRRVVRHEAGHTLGFPHEHLRRELVARLDPARTKAYFARTAGWTEERVVSQVLTALAEGQIRRCGDADERSIMCYELPGSITVDGKPILGGDDLTAADRREVARLYPKLPRGK